MPSITGSKTEPRGKSQVKEIAPPGRKPKALQAKTNGTPDGTTHGKALKERRNGSKVSATIHLINPAKSKVRPTVSKSSAGTSARKAATVKTAPVDGHKRVALFSDTRSPTSTLKSNGAGRTAAKTSGKNSSSKDTSTNGAVRSPAKASSTRTGTISASRAINGRGAKGAMHNDGSTSKQANGAAANGSAQRTKPQPKRAEAAANGDIVADARRSEISLQPSYKPSDGEPFMNAQQRLYFRSKLLKWKEDIVRQNLETLKGLHDDSSQQADPADRATAETDRALELRARDRQRKLMGKIDQALARIEEGSYGYCEETGDPISLKRLDARPIATLTLEAQERRERRERIFRED